MLFHYWDKEKPREIERFKQDDDFLLNFENFHQSVFQRPVTGESLGTVPFTLEQPTATRVEQLTGKPAMVVSSQQEKRFLQKIKAWIRS